VVETHKSTVITTTLREAVISSIRSLAVCMSHTDADAAVISVEWHGPAGNSSPNDHPAYQITLTLPPLHNGAPLKSR
jgi:hypothetical protein